MKAIKNNITSAFKTVLILLLIVFQSCGTYNSKTSDIESNLFSGDFNQAIAGIDQNKFLLKERNRLLYLMEKGKIEHLRGNYDASNALLEQAYIMIDDRIKTNVGQAVAAKFTNPMAEPYKGEDFEKVTIHYYKALNYFHLGMPDEALVEAKRINIKLYELNEKYVENKNKYSEDAFSQILQGILYESTGDINNAFIAYRNAEKIYSNNNGYFFGVPMPEQLKQDLLRTSKLMGFKEEHEAYRKQFNIAPDPVAKKAPVKKGAKGAKNVSEPEPAKKPEVTGEAIVFWENGLGPAKDQIVITASGGSGVFYGSYMDGDVLEEILIPIPPGSGIGSINAIAIPKYRKRESYYNKAVVVLDGKEQPFELAQDYYPIAKQCLKDRMLREVIDIVVRFAAKKAASAALKEGAGALFGGLAGDLTKLGADAAGAATEKADTRNWQTLPATISYIRVPLTEGDNRFVIRKYGPQGIDTDTLTIPYKKGLQIVNYFDLGRTQVTTPVNNQEALAGMVSTLTVKKEEANTNRAALQITDSPTKSVSIPASNFKPAENGVTAQTVVQKYITAIGGEENLKAVQTQYMKAQTLANGQVSSEIIIKSSGSKMFTQYIMNGKPFMTTLINDEGAFEINEKGKRKKMDKSMAEVLKGSNPGLYEACLIPLNYGAQMAGITNINNEEVYAIHYTEPVSKGKITSYYSTKTGLITASSSTIDIPGTGPMTTTNYFSDYRNINGVQFPFKMTSSINGMTSEMVYLDVKFNEGITDADFQ